MSVFGLIAGFFYAMRNQIKPNYGADGVGVSACTTCGFFRNITGRC